jgi:SAM-dependent methyltransferase
MAFGSFWVDSWSCSAFMNVTHKLTKLADGSALKSAGNAFDRWRQPINPEKVLEQIDQAGLDQIRVRHAVPGERTHWPKYLDAPRWTRLNIRRAQELRLKLRPKPLRILDLGSGAGYFLLVAKYLGHSGIGLDIADPEMYGEMFELFGFQRVIWEINAYQRLPDLGEKFDLVTAFSICFNGHKRPDLWGPKEWEFFLDDLHTHVLKPSGEIFLGMNPEEDGSFYDSKLKDFFRQRGARIDRSKIWFRGDQ